MKKVVIFDFWGTLVDSGIRSPLKQVQRTLSLDMTYPEFVVRAERAMMTQRFDNLQEVFVSVCKEFGVEPTPSLLDELVGMWNKSWLLSRPYEDTIEVLQKLHKNYKVVLISNTDYVAVTGALDKFDMKKYFDLILLSCDIGALKTDPSVYQMIFDTLGVDAADCVAVGDSVQTDVVAAEQAGVDVFLIDRRNKREFEHKIMSLQELLPLLDTAQSVEEDE